jgi:defect-in-organelle-trafficking protein DotC
MDQEGARTLKKIIEKDEVAKSTQSDIKNLRPRAIRRTARTLAIQKAVAWRYEQIKELLEEHSSRLNHIFDFAPLMMGDGKVLPPVITEAGASYRVKSQKRASSTSTTYRIIAGAKMVSSPPSWRDYLLRSYPSFDKSDAGVIPKNHKEREIWKEAALEGWQLGIEHARRLFRTNLSELVRDYKGILKFRLLAEQNIVSAPIVAEGKVGVQIQGKQMSVDRKVFRITRETDFQEAEKWEPKVGKSKN